MKFSQSVVGFAVVLGGLAGQGCSHAAFSAVDLEKSQTLVPLDSGNNGADSAPVAGSSTSSSSSMGNSLPSSAGSHGSSGPSPSGSSSSSRSCAGGHMREAASVVSDSSSVLCILNEGPHNQELGLLSRDLSSGNSNAVPVCISAQACKGAIATAFAVATSGDSQYCANNPSALRLSDAQIADLLY